MTLRALGPVTVAVAQSPEATALDAIQGVDAGGTEPERGAVLHSGADAGFVKHGEGGRAQITAIVAEDADRLCLLFVATPRTSLAPPHGLGEGDGEQVCVGHFGKRLAEEAQRGVQQQQRRMKS